MQNIIKLRRNSIVCLILTGLLLSTFLIVKPVVAEPSYQNISVQQARELITQNPNCLIIDVRNSSEFSIGHLCDALSVPLYQLESMLSYWNLTANTQYAIASQNDTILVYCAAGSRSTMASEILVEYNYTQVYNMAGGINAWINADYEISTTYHNVNFVFENDSLSTIEIQPLLATFCGCGNDDATCGSNPYGNCSATQFFSNSNKTILEDIPNHTVTEYQHSINGTPIDYTIDETLLWRQTSVINQINRTLTFKQVIMSNESVTSEFYSLGYNIVNIDLYNLTIMTLLAPQDNDTYSGSLTYISYRPNGEGSVQTIENIVTNSTVTLSELYSSLSTVIAEIGQKYGDSEDEALHKFEPRYLMISNETADLSQIVSQNLTIYDKAILRSSTLLEDDWMTCLLCEVAVNAILAGGCGLITACTWGLAATFCSWIVAADLIGSGYQYICETLAQCWQQGLPTHEWINNVVQAVSDPPYSTIDAPNAVVGDYGWIHTMATMRTYGPSRIAHIIGQMSQNSTTYAHGEITIWGGLEGGSNHAQVYIYTSSDYVTWNFVGAKIVNSYTNWIDFGYTNTCFRYVDIALYQSPSDQTRQYFEVDVLLATP